MIQPPPSAYHVEAQSKQNRILIKMQQVEQCLMHVYHIDQTAATKITLLMAPLLQDLKKHEILDDFIHQSHHFGIWFCACRGFPWLESDDGVLVASKWHEIVFDSAQIRVLYGQTAPGEVEPAHRHGFRSIMLVTEGSTFKIEGADGTNNVAEFAEGVYVLPAETTSYSYTNVGSSTFSALRFEVKS